MGAVGDTLGHICAFVVAQQDVRVADDLSIAADNVQGRTDFVTHVLQEAYFHAFCLLCLVASDEQFTILTLKTLHVARAVPAINQKSDDQNCDKSKMECPLQEGVFLTDGIVQRFSILKVIGRTNHLFTHDDIVY